MAWESTRHADPDLAASDGKTPCFAACMQDHVAVLDLLREHNADTTQPDQDGTAPVHVAAAFDSIGAIQWLYRTGTDMSQPGTIYLHDYSKDEQQEAAWAAEDAEHAALKACVEQTMAERDAEGAPALTEDEYGEMVRAHLLANGLATEAVPSLPKIDYKHLHTSMTPLMIARRCKATDVVQFLEKICCLKRVRSTLSLEERADAAGVPRARLKVIPQSLVDEAKSAVKEKSAAAKKAIQRIQVANQQVVARAEKKLKAN